MRPGQNTKRPRGRPNNRKGPNPLTRTYESSGPDVKIRGTAHHIGEKYLQLARDAQSSGDPVMAESYLQHAEHYFRLIATAQQAQQAAVGYPRLPGDPVVEDFDDGDDFTAIPDRFASPPERFIAPAQPAFVPQPAPAPLQPNFDKPYYGTPERGNFERPERPARPERPFQDKPYADRGGERPYSERSGQGAEGRSQRGGRGTRDYRGDSQNRPDPQRIEARAPNDDVERQGLERQGLERQGLERQGLERQGLPAFITAPVRAPSEASEEPGPAVATLPSVLTESPEMEHEVNGYHLRPRRRRRSKAEMALSQESAGQDTDARDPVGD